MQMTRKALYNLLRMNWLQQPGLSVAPWQVEDYRKADTEELFARLRELGVQMDKMSFLVYAENCDSPEDLAELYHNDGEADMEWQDRLYLLLFELWRRFVPESRSISVFCDELDAMILDYDREAAENDEALQDALAGLRDILDESVDAGEEPIEVFRSVKMHCAHDLESFLYDYIAEQIDAGNTAYASELLEGFSSYVEDERWFDLLTARIQSGSDIEGANHSIREILNEEELDPNLDLRLEILDFLSQSGDRDLFISLVKGTLPLVETEEDFVDVLRLCGQYYGCLDVVEKEQAVGKLVSDCLKRKPCDPFQFKDRAAESLLGILTS